MAAANRDQIVSFCDQLLEIERFADYCPNGLQVPGAVAVDCVVSGVSANLELLRGAAEAGAQLVLVHHGVFWEGGSRALTPALAERLRVLLGEDISLAGYHLPLDAHPAVGNNALICEKLGLEKGERFGEAKGVPIGFVARPAEGTVPLAGLSELVRHLTGREPLVFAAGHGEIASVGVVSGGGAGMLEEAAALGLDAILTGEPNEPAAAGAHENGVHFIAAGHHATETFGVRRLGELVAERFGVEHRFIDIPNPV
ncbi:MAG: Nif3-like dinuclear metal center hexameric protein [Solirubrobacterales bacterium]